MMRQTDVLIVGAGPTGLVLALWLTKLGVPVRIIDKTSEPGTTSRALAVHARTLELYQQLDLTDAVLQRGHRVPAAQLWVKGKPVTRISFDEAGQDFTPYPFLHIFPQDEHERLLIARLADIGVTVERRTELLRMAQDANGITAVLRGPDGDEQTCAAAYLAGCDGARSIVRECMGTGFPGGTYRELFYVADVEARGPAANGDLHADLDEADFLAVFPLASSVRMRLIGTVRDERADRADTLTFADVSDRAIHNMKIEVDKVNWFSTYHVHHRVSAHFREGRAFLLGDAAHIHSPVGGQGMNTGIGDAINLAWKLAAALKDGCQESLLDSYEPERLAFARKLVATTDRAFTFVNADGWWADFVRTRLFPPVVSAMSHIERARAFAFRTVSQTRINYRDGPLSAGKAGEVHGGDRLPWVTYDGGDNYAPLAAICWQVHVYGTPGGGIATWCSQHRLALHVIPWQPGFARKGLVQNALYLLRPDSYVALADPSPRPEKLERYFLDRGLPRPTSEAA